MIEDLETAKDWVKNGGCPDQAGVIFDLVVWDANLVVLDLLIDIVELEVEFIDHRAIGEIAAAFSCLATRNVDSV